MSLQNRLKVLERRAPRPRRAAWTQAAEATWAALPDQAARQAFLGRVRAWDEALAAEIAALDAASVETGRTE